jgi:hypothetical protein
MMCVAFMLTVSCSKHKEQNIVPKNTKEMYLSKEQQAKITSQAKASFEAIHKRMLQKNSLIDSFGQNPNVLLNLLLGEIRAQDSVAYDTYANSQAGVNFLQNYLNMPVPQGSQNFINNLESYTTSINDELLSIENPSDSALVDSLVAKFQEVTLNYENQVINDQNLSSDEKTMMLVVTTHVFAIADEAMDILYLFDGIEYQAKKKGNGWRTLKRRIVSAFIYMVVGATAAVAGVVVSGGALGVAIAPLLPWAVAVGAGAGLVASIYDMTRNNCLYFYQGKLQKRPCRP